MSHLPSSDEAAAALSTVEQRQRQIVDRVQIPTGYWPCLAVVMVAFAAAVDRFQNRPVLLGLSVVLFVAAILGLTGWAIRRSVRAQVSSRLLGNSGAFAIVVFVLADVGISLALAFAAQARGLTHPATTGVTVGAILLVLGGPRLTSYLRAHARTLP